MKSCAFKCELCEKSKEACLEDYVMSGYRPGKADDNAFYLFDSDYLLWWYFLQHKVPGTSSNKFLETTEEMSRSYFRVGSRVQQSYIQNVILYYS